MSEEVTRFYKEFCLVLKGLELARKNVENELKKLKPRRLMRKMKRTTNENKKRFCK